MDGKAFLDTARFLREHGSDEAAWRSAVSRAYYACFLAARQVAFANCAPAIRLKAAIKNERKIRHDHLQRCLKHSASGTIQQLGQDLAGLYGNRQDADYDMLATLTVADAQDALDHAQAFLGDLSRIPAEEIGRAMADAIQQTYA